MSTHNSLGESKQLSSDSMDGLVIGANLENEDMNYIVPALSLEHAAREAALADGLIENGMRGSMKPKKIGLRRGKWTQEEETYANKLIAEFKLGTLPLTDGTTLRTFLSKLLNCDPMRISKKFVGAKCIGKQVFRRRSTDLDKMSSEQIEINRHELAELERNFLDKVSQTNKVKGPGHDDDDPVGGDEQGSTWMGSPGMNSGRGHSNGGGGIHALYAKKHVTQIKQSNSTTDMLEFRNIMDSSGGLSQLANQALYYAEGLSPYGYVNATGNFPRQSSLEVLCALDGTRMSGSDSLNNFGGLYKSDSFSWGKSGELSPGAPVDLSAVNSNYYNATGGSGNGRRDGYFGGASLPYSSSAEWPSMNNLVVAAETIESLGSMNSLLGGGLMEQISALRNMQGGNVEGEVFPVANQANLYGVAARPNSVNADFAPGQLRTTSQNSMQDRASNHSRASHHSGGRDEAATSAMETALNMTGNSNTVGGPDGIPDNDVGYPIDEDDGPDTGTNSVSVHTENSSTLQINREALKAVPLDNIDTSPVENTPITNMLRAKDAYDARVAAIESANGRRSDSANNLRLAAVSRNTSSGLSVSSEVPKNSSVNDFWMLVGLGDLPRPDQDVLSSTIFPSESEKSSAADKSQTNVSSMQENESPAQSPVRPLGSPRISPNQLPPHLRNKQPRPASVDSLSAMGENGSTAASESSSQKQPRKKGKVDVDVGVTTGVVKKSASFNKTS